VCYTANEDEMTKRQRRLRVSVVAILLGEYNVILAGLNHRIWHLINNPEFRDAFNDKEMEFLKRRYEELDKNMRLISRLTHKLRQTP
jgi:L-2-hydroxyglutarate oxidase LhgO